ncbi:helix-turn-helix domain-containing protein [Haladaptatus salinisoli]|uniref:helix-turn-helix domain-containing protein n=1 Tax=Haladaptatus salinisoli TaxID=2884876 RepID=UPI001D0B28F3|nr:helix-turn-helix domain-containing protein [Haladaptatus salinisoli]
MAREYLYHFNLLDDGTVVLLYQLQGDLDHARATFAASSTVIHYDVPEQGNGLTYLHCEMQEPLTSFLSILHETDVLMPMPVQFLSDDRLRVKFIGDYKPLQRILERVSEFVDIEIEQAGEYVSPGHLNSVLTDRQHEILSTAIEYGYYEVPRQATIQEIADGLGLSQATVGEHLQKIEARILSQAVR